MPYLLPRHLRIRSLSGSAWRCAILILTHRTHALRIATRTQATDMPQMQVLRSWKCNSILPDFPLSSRRSVVIELTGVPRCISIALSVHLILYSAIPTARSQPISPLFRWMVSQLALRDQLAQRMPRLHRMDRPF